MTRLNLLIIHNNQIDSSKMANFLGSLGHSVYLMNNIDESLEYIANNRPELVLVQENLDNSNAQDFIIKASQKKVFTHTAFLIMQNQTPDEATKIKYMSLGFSYFITNQTDEKNLEHLKFCLNEEINLIQLLKAG